MGLLGEALFLFLGKFKNASQTGPDRLVASPDNQDGACVFPSPGCLVTVIPLGQIPMYA